jgi:hypothetical protein
MTATKPVVTKMEDIQSLLDNAPKDAVDDAAPLSLAAVLREKAEALGEQYLVHRLEGGKKKAFLATLSEEDADFFRALRIDEVIAESISKELAEKAKAAKPDGEVFDKLVEDEKAKAKAKKAKLAKTTKEEKAKKKDKKITIVQGIANALHSGINRHRSAWGI